MLFLGNALKTLDLALFKGLKIQCCVTSPPYFGLRDYGNDIVFDPFMGSGTTAIAASLHGRKWAGCELNEDYVKIMQQRLNKEFEVLK